MGETGAADALIVKGESHRWIPVTERLKKFVEQWNKHGAETLLGDRTEPPKEETC